MAVSYTHLDVYKRQAGMVILMLCKMFRRKSGYITSIQENLRDRVRNMLRRQYEYIRKQSRRTKTRTKMVRIHWRKMMPHNIVPEMCIRDRCMGL